MENSGIEWTTHTFNAVIGCEHATYVGSDGREHAHQGCLNCYAEQLQDRRYGRVRWGRDGTRSLTSREVWRKPLRWDRDARALGERHRVFCESLGDLFEDWQGRIVDSKGRPLLINDGEGSDGATYPEGALVGDDWGRRALTMGDVRERVFQLVDCTVGLDWLMLTKRSGNVRRFWGKRGGLDVFRGNVWLGQSASDQESLDSVLAGLTSLRDLAPVAFLSLEPLLGPLDLRGRLVGVDWVIVGGESDQIFPARSCRLTWLRDVVRQCADAGVACFVKQLGSNVEEGVGVHRKLRFSDGKGGDESEWPADLRVRQFPVVLGR